MKISSEWTPEERLAIVSELLNLVQDDIYAHEYSRIGRPNITSLQYVIHLPKEVLEANRASVEDLLNQPRRSIPESDSDIPFPDPGFGGGPV